MRAWLLAAGALAAIVALLFARPHPTPGPPMRDFEAYYAAGTLWNHGGDPYSQAIWRAEQPLGGVNAQRYEALPFVGPPAALPLFALIARLPFDAANMLWRALLIAALAVIALLTLRMAHYRITPFTFFAIAIAALGFGPLTSALALGQIALPAFTCAVIALSWQPAAFFTWVQPNVALSLLPQMFTRRALGFLAAAALFGAACVLSVGMSGAVRYAAVLHEHAWAEQFSAIQLTPASIAYGFGASPQIAAVIGTAAAIAAIGCWALLMRAATETAARFAATCALLPLAMPFFHEHDLLVVFVPAVLYVTRADARVWPFAASGALLAATDWLGLAQRPDGTLQTLLLVGAFGAALVALHERPRAQMLVAPGAVLALIGIAAFVAHAHPAPVWPDAMGSLPRDIARMDISHAWNAQQQATGLFRQDAIWSALRLLSLAGCGLTAAAIAVSSRYPAGSRSPLPGPA